MGELGKAFGLTLLLAALFALAWAGIHLLRARRLAQGVALLVPALIGLSAYAWIARGLQLSNEFELESLASASAVRYAAPGVERAREEYYRSGSIAQYRDAKGVERTFSPSREDRIRRDRRIARAEGYRRGVQLSGVAMYAALAAMPLAMLGGLLWPRPAPPGGAAVEPAPRRRGFRFTLVELLVVIAVLGSLALFGRPDDVNLAAATTVRNAAVKLELLKPDIAEFRRARNAWPARNAELGLPEQGYAVANYTLQLQGDGGVLLKTRWGDASFRPAVDAKGEIAWLCAYESVPDGFRVFGENRTTLTRNHLPGECLG